MGVTEKCGKPAGPLVPRYGWSFACVLDEGHEGDCQPGKYKMIPGGYIDATGPHRGEPLEIHPLLTIHRTMFRED